VANDLKNVISRVMLQRQAGDVSRLVVKKKEFGHDETGRGYSEPVNHSKYEAEKAWKKGITKLERSLRGPDADGAKKSAVLSLLKELKSKYASLTGHPTSLFDKLMTAVENDDGSLSKGEAVDKLFAEMYYMEEPFIGGSNGNPVEAVIIADLNE